MIDRTQDRRDYPSAATSLGAIALISIIVAVATGEIGDYPAYLQQWALITDGKDPWSPFHNGTPVPFNAYGPLHAILGYTVPLHQLAPKIIFTLCSIATFLILIKANSRPRPSTTRKSNLFLTILLPLSPLVIVHTYAYGGNDIVCVFLTVAACELRARNRLVLAGIALGLGALMKFYPLLFAPYLCICHGGRANLRPLIAAIGVFAAGMLFCAVVVDWDVMAAVGGGVTRDPKSLSILRFAQTAAENSGSGTLKGFVEFLISNNSLFVVGVATATALWGWLFGINWRTVMLIGILAIFTTYKVGHTQFFIVWTAVLAWILADSDDPASARLAKAFLPLAIFLSIMALKSAALQIAYIELPQFTSTFGRFDYYWRSVSSLFLWAVIIFCIVRARPTFSTGSFHRPKISL